MVKLIEARLIHCWEENDRNVTYFVSIVTSEGDEEKRNSMWRRNVLEQLFCYVSL